MQVIGLNTEQQRLRRGVKSRRAGTAVDQMSRSAERVWPERRRHGRMNEHRPNTIVEGLEDALGAPIL